jgi:thioredoxin reductase (NADPH)
LTSLFWVCYPVNSMFDWDVVIIGGGPAGLSAGIYLSRAMRRVLLLDKDTAGGYLRNIELIENYPGYPDGISGAALASQMVAQAQKFGVQIENAEVTGIESFSGTRYVACANGEGYTTNVVIIAAGSKNKKLNVAGEAELLGRGVFECALCDGGQYAGKTVVVCGGGDAGVTEALYMSRIASKVICIEANPGLTATAILQERLAAAPNVEVRLGVSVTAVLGQEKVEAIELMSDSKKETLKVDGVLVHIGLEPNTAYLEDVIPLDKQGQVIVSKTMESEEPYIFAAGDVRSGSPRQVVVAVADGAMAALSAERLLQESAS